MIKKSEEDFLKKQLYNTPIKGREEICKEIKQAFIGAFLPIVKDVDPPLVEFFEEASGSLVVKIRGCWNDYLKGISLDNLVALLYRIRTLFNMRDLKRVKLQCSIHETDPDKTNIRAIYNPKWRRYENYEIFFRSKTQSRRKHSL